MASSVWAAEAASPAADGAEVEAITVIGSQIQGAKITGALPVAVVGTDQIQATGAVSAGDLFRTLPQAGDVSFNEQTLGNTSPNAARGDISTVTLRGLGQGNTLLLLNGRRVVLHPTSQTDLSSAPVFGFNANAIPTAGLARVEVLRDGAAALYGSDAVAGVVNNVLQSNYRGLQLDAQYGGAEGTSLQEFSFNSMAGADFNEGRGNISLFVGYTEHSALRVSDQDFTRSSDRRSLVVGTPFEGVTNFDGRSSSSAWASFQSPVANGTLRAGTASLTNASGVFHIQPNSISGCGAQLGGGVCLASGAITAANLRDLRLDTNLSFPTNTVQPGLQRVNLFSFINYQLTPGLKFFSELGYYTAITKGYGGPGGPLSSTAITMSPTAYWNPFGAVGVTNRLPGLTNVPASGLPLTLVSYNLVDAGQREDKVVNEQYRLLGGLKGETFGFKWESALLYNAATVADTADGSSSTLFQRALNGTTPAAYNPFNGGNVVNTSLGDSTPNASASSFVIKNTRANKTTLSSWDLKASRPDLFNLPGGPVGIAVGVEVRHESYQDNRDFRQDGSTPYVDMVTGVSYGSDLLGASPSPDVKGKRTVESAYAELAVPLIGPEMHIPLARSIDLQLAGRFENYSDVGSVAKPKVAGSWDLLDGVRVRASWSQGFRAPNLETLNTPVLERFNTRTDYTQCEQDLRAKRIATFSACTRSYGASRIYSGNPDLKPETSDSFSYGAVLQPKFWPPEYGDLTLTVDRWRIRQQGVIGVFDDQNAITLDYLARVQGSSNPAVIRLAPTADDVAAAAGTGMAPVGQVIKVNAVFENLLPRNVEGLDIGLSYRLRETPLGSFQLDANMAKLITFFQSPSAGQQQLLDGQAKGLINKTIAIAGAQDLVRAGGLPKYKWSATLTWDMGPVQAGVFTQYTGAVFDTGVVDPVGDTWLIKSQITVNAYAQYTLRKGWASNTSFRLGVRNIGNKNPPVSAAGYLGSLYQPQARYWYGSIHKSF
jgi:outer membrane receptor protein involved in Fe transport